MEVSANVTVFFKDDTEEEFDVEIEIDEFSAYETKKDRKDYVKDQARKQINKVYPKKKIKRIEFDADDLADLEAEIDDIEDTSDMHPNESFEDFMEHEDFE